MLFMFKQALHLSARDTHGNYIYQKDFARGKHDISEQVMMNPHFHKMMKVGFIEAVAEHIEPLSQKERNEMIIEQVLKRPAPQVIEVAPLVVEESPKAVVEEYLVQEPEEKKRKPKAKG